MNYKFFVVLFISGLAVFITKPMAGDEVIKESINLDLPGQAAASDLTKDITSEINSLSEKSQEAVAPAMVESEVADVLPAVELEKEVELPVVEPKPELEKAEKDIDDLVAPDAKKESKSQEVVRDEKTKIKYEEIVLESKKSDIADEKIKKLENKIDELSQKVDKLSDKIDSLKNNK